jgi:hypothetical protein
MIPKDIFANLYLKLYQAKIKRGGRTARVIGRTVWLLLADCPSGQRGPSAWLVGRRCITGHSRCNNGPSALGVRTVRAPRGLSAGCRGPSARAARRWDPGRGIKSSRHLSSFPQPDPIFSLLSFLLPLKEKASLLGVSIGALPGPSEHISGLFARFSTMSSGYFSNLSFYLSDFEQGGD